jgi:peptide/nickel transport system ATP-binding protein
MVAVLNMINNPDASIEETFVEKGKYRGSQNHSDTLEPLLTVDRLCVEFPSRNGAITACDKLTFEIKRGEIVGIVGESGSGKSITVLSVLRLIPAPGRVTAGSIYFNGSNLSDLDRREVVRLRGRQIGFVSQTPRASLNPALRVRDQILAILHKRYPYIKTAETRQRIEELLAPMGFKDPERVCNSFPHQLSGGMCQRVAIALALAYDPSLLIADEPTTALDAAVQFEILALLRRLRNDLGLSIIIVTHDLSVVRAITDSVVVIKDGEVKETGETDKILRQPSHPYTKALLKAFPDTIKIQERSKQSINQNQVTSSLSNNNTRCGIATGKPLVLAEGLYKRFRTSRFGRSNYVTAVDGVSLSIDTGKTLALVGESGSGKSTVARLLIRLITPDSGEVFFDGKNLADLRERSLIDLRHGFQMVFQDPQLSLNPRRTIAANLMRPLENAGVHGAELNDRVETLLNDVGLDTGLKNRFAGEISGGQCQRVAIARALALEPKFLILDEPTSALDVSVQAEILELLLELQDHRNLTYLFVTHDLKLVNLMADEVSVMSQGCIVESGSSYTVFNEPEHPYTKSLLQGVLSLSEPPNWELFRSRNED